MAVKEVESWVGGLVAGSALADRASILSKYLKTSHPIAGPILQYAIGEITSLGGIANQAAESIAGNIYELKELKLKINKHQDCKRVDIQVVAHHQFNIPFLNDPPKTESVTFEGFVSRGFNAHINQACGLT